MLRSIVQYLLRWFAKKIVKKYKPDIVGITGSVGKTSAKEAAAAVLARRFSVRRTVKNYNNEIGVPLTILGFDKTPGASVWGWLKVFSRALALLFARDKNYPDILVLEMGADKPGDVQYLVDMAPCKVGVLTFISHAHTEFFKTIKKIAQEKRIIISHLNRDGFAVLNFDSELVMQNASATKAEIVTYGYKEGADLRVTDVNLIKDEITGWPTGMNFKVIFKGSVIPVFLPRAIAKSPLISAAACGLAIGTVFGVNLIEGSQALSELEPLAGHMCLLPGIKETLIVDDTYNSSPEAVKAALESLAQISIGLEGARYAVLGDMLELGAETENAHRELGFLAAGLGIDHLLTVGVAAKHMAAAAREAGLNTDKIFSFDQSGEAGKFLQERMKRGDVILVKGSQSMRMERIVKEIMAEPAQAEKLLVRQGKEWQN
ncbi:UDP-N-acetylmuramoyl-tripeptide--D-alanyl-D-alanine ligase [Patescibacteria group bacterium]|nr:MAG: UDP-N-acetylmuramoyl-tripeptide--D-alanyl-D-alanine ligase [Patescibacteria group bacterium]